MNNRTTAVAELGTLPGEADHESTAAIPALPFRQEMCLTFPAQEYSTSVRVYECLPTHPLRSGPRAHGAIVMGALGVEGRRDPC
ncbi:unnamed protein product [Arctogadus glacialis]